MNHHPLKLRFDLALSRFVIMVQVYRLLISHMFSIASIDLQLHVRSQAQVSGFQSLIKSQETMAVRFASKTPTTAAPSSL
jgi:hypothetical protein